MRRPARVSWVALGAICACFGLASGVARAASHGDFITAYQKPETPDYTVFYEEMRREHFLENVAQELNRVLDLPATVMLRMAECGHSTTRWSPETRMVTICYEFLDAALVIAGQAQGQPGGSSGKSEQLFSGAVTFALFNEVGQALVSLYNLPVPQGAEHAGEEFAAITLAASEQDGDTSAASALEFFETALRQPDSGFEYLETHEFTRARLETIACLLYGNMPANHAQALARGLVTAERAPHCGDELLAVAKAWDGYLRDHPHAASPPPPAARGR